MPQRILTLLGFWLCYTVGYAQFYQGSYNEFGKNRVQYRTFLWQHYRFEQFDTYFYEGGQQLASFTSRVAERNIRMLEDLFDYTLQDKVQFIVYNTQSDFRQSNVGLTTEVQNNIGGTARIVGSKVFVYFDGDYVRFEQNIREGLAHVIINQVLYGGGWREVVRSSTLLTLPDWYIEGLVMYASRYTDPDVESRIRSGVMNGDYHKFNRLQGREAHIAGYALWRYVADVYGENIIPSILYMSRVSRNVESGFLFVLGKSLTSITKEFIAYYHGEYTLSDLAKAETNLEKVPIKTRKNYIYTQFEVNPDGSQAAYVSNIMGQYRLYLHDMERNKRKKILKAEHKLDRIQDYSFPVITWHPSGRALTYVTEKRGKLLMTTYNLDDKKSTTREIFQLDKVLSMAYSPNGQLMAFSGVDNGQTDLYLYYLIGNRQERLTNDMYSVFDPSFTKDGSKILFTSNRPDDTLRTGVKVTEVPRNLDVFAYNVKRRSNILERITDTPGFSERNPYQYDSIRYTFRAHHEGIINRYTATYDSVISRIDTTIHYRYFTTAQAISNYRNDLLSYKAHPATGRFSTIEFKDRKYHFYTGRFADDARRQHGVPLSSDSDAGDSKDPKTSDTKYDGIEEVTPIVLNPPRRKEPEVDISNYTFEGEKNFSYQKETVTLTETVGTKKRFTPSRDGTTKLDSLTLPGARNYNLNFSTDYVLGQIDNTFMSEFYQPLAGPGAINPGLNGMVRLGVSDLFEDYRISGGFQVPVNLDNSGYILNFEDLSKRVDKRITGMRQANRYFTEQSVEKIITHQLNYRLSYPINEVFSLRGTGFIRHDRFVTLGTDNVSLIQPNRNAYLAGLKGEVVFDNVLPMGINLFRGMRWKFWGEYCRDPEGSDVDIIVLGFDWRHYQPIHRQLIWANRVAFNTSLGQQRLLHFLGGVDNWMFPRADNSIPIDLSQNYRFQTLASPMRGFFNNTRNGTSFAVANSELRWPVFRYLFNRPIKNDFLENFQLIAFGDMGSAWTGPSPFSEENSFNQTVVRTGALTLEIENNRNPVVFGYGFGLRSRLLGYFVRADWAWGIDDGITLPRVFYLSLALDF
jgi:Tol biopolymer transport system component